MTSEVTRSGGRGAENNEQSSIVRVYSHTVTLPFRLGNVCFLRLGFKAHIVHSPFDPNAEPLRLPLVPPQIADDVEVEVHFGKPLPQGVLPLYANGTTLCYVLNRSATHFIDLRGSFADYLKEFSHKRRNTLQRNVRKLATASNGTMVCRAYRGPGDAQVFHKLAREVAVKTYQEKLFDGAIPGTREFLANLQARARNDSYRGFILLVGDRPISYIYLPIENGVVELRYLGFDPEFSESSPGTVLMYLALESIFAEDAFRFFNLSFGEGQMKRVFGRGTFMQGDLYYFRRSMRNIFAVYGHLWTDRSSDWIGNILATLGIRKAIRRAIRSIWIGRDA